MISMDELRLYEDNSNHDKKAESFSRLEIIRKKGTITDYDSELASYREEKYNTIIHMDEASKDGRLTEPSDGKIFDYRKMFELVKQLGRPLTDKEAEQFRIK